MNSLLQILFNNAAFGISEQFQIAHGNESTSARLTDGKALFFQFLIDAADRQDANLNIVCKVPNRRQNFSVL